MNFGRKLPHQNIWRKNFCISGKKSSSALLLGGLPISLTIMSAFLFYRPINFSFYSEIAFCLSMVLITIYGYVDDRIELRSLVKLSFQLLASFIFSFALASQFEALYSHVSFIGVFIVSMGAMNGVNLLDGMDTLTVKIASAVLLCYCFISYHFNINSILLFSCSLLVVLSAFYFFNRVPAKIHLGEIGGAALGLTYVMMSSVVFYQIHLLQKMSTLNALAIALLPLSVYGVEVLVSFGRRLIRGGSPFCGDQFHVHHLLRSHYKLSINKSTTYISLGVLFVLSVAAFLIFYTPVSALMVTAATTSLFIFFQYRIGRKTWFGNENSQYLIKSFLKSLKKDELILIDTNISQDFQILIHKKNKASDEDDNNRGVA